MVRGDSSPGGADFASEKKKVAKKVKKEAVGLAINSYLYPVKK